MKTMRTAEEWVESGVPFATEPGPYIRWVAEIQNDAVQCYDIQTVIVEIQESFEAFKDGRDPEGVELARSIELLNSFRLGD